MAQAFDPIEQAMIETNREIAAEAWDQESVPLDTDNDRTPESLGDGLEGQHLEEDDADEVEAEGEEAESVEAEEGEEDTEAEAEPGKDETEADKVEAKPEEKPNGKVPSGVLRQEKEQRRAAEAKVAERDAQLETERASHRKEIDALNAKFDGMLTLLQRQQQTGKPNGEDKSDVVAPPDIFENPTGFVDHITKGFTTELLKRDQQLSNLRVDMSMQVAHAIHKDVFEKAVEEARKVFTGTPTAEDNATANRIYGSQNPGESLVTWYKRREALREVGEDPAAYKQRIIDEQRKALLADPEFRKQVIADLETEARGGNGRPANTITRLPKSLAAAGGSARVGQAADDFDGSDQAVADSAWR